MPLGPLDFAIALLVVLGVPIAAVLLGKWRRGAGWWLIGGVLAFIVFGNLVEKLATGSSALF